MRISHFSAFKRRLLWIFFDTLIYLFAFFAVYLVTNGWFRNPEFLIYGGVFYVVIISLRLLFRFYQTIWRYPSTQVYIELMLLDAGAYGITMGLTVFLGCFIRILPSALLCTLVTQLTLLSRLAYRNLYASKAANKHGVGKIHVAIVGAGNTGVLLVKELASNPNSDYAPYCFIDSDPRKAGNYIAGVRVYPENEHIVETLKTMPVQEIILAMPINDPEHLRQLYTFYAKTGFKVKLYDFPQRESEGTDQSLRVREIRILSEEDLRPKEAEQPSAEAEIDGPER